jgi:2-furoyl-CoA dehydrogenase large subunit
MHRIAMTLGLDPLEVIRRNLVETFPYRCPAGAVLDSGDYGAAVDVAAARGGLAELRGRRDLARAEGRLYGIGFAAIVEPSISNMGYITTVLSPQERQKAGPKGGAQAAATVALDPLGGVSVAIDSVPQGQGHRTVTAQIVADVFGLTPAVIRVDAGLDTSKGLWRPSPPRFRFQRKVQSLECQRVAWARASKGRPRWLPLPRVACLGRTVYQSRPPILER